MEHIHTGMFEDLFWSTVSDIELVDNYVANRFKGSGISERTVDKAAQLWMSASGKNTFSRKITEVAAELGGITELVSAVDYCPCWLTYQVMIDLSQLAKKLIGEGLYSSTRNSNAEFTYPDYDTNYYGFEFPDWLALALTQNIDESTDYNGRIAGACKLESGHRLTAVTFKECGVCCVLKPTIWQRKAKRINDKSTGIINIGHNESTGEPTNLARN